MPCGLAWEGHPISSLAVFCSDKQAPWAHHTKRRASVSMGAPGMEGHGRVRTTFFEGRS